MLFQRSSLDFPYGALGQAGQEENLFRHLISRDLLFGKFNQFSLGSRYSFPPGDIRDHDLGPCFIRDADNPGFGHRRVLVENGFYFLRRNVGAASDDEFLLAPANQ